MKSKKMQKIRRRILISVILSTILIIASCSKEIDTTAAIENLEITMNNYQLNASGQTLLYNCSGEEVSGEDLYPQDGNYASGEELEFHDNGLAVNVSKDEQFWTSNIYLVGTTHKINY